MRIVEAKTTALVTAGRPAVVAVTLQGDAVGGERSVVVLEQDGVEIARAVHAWSTDDERGAVQLTYAPAESGLSVLRVRALPVRGETTEDDNVADVGVRVVARAWRVLTWAPRPSWTVAFVRRALEADAAFDVSALTRSSRGLETRSGTAPARLTADALAPFDIVIAGAPEELDSTRGRGARHVRPRPGWRGGVPARPAAVGRLSIAPAADAVRRNAAGTGRVAHGSRRCRIPRLGVRAAVRHARARRCRRHGCAGRPGAPGCRVLDERRRPRGVFGRPGRVALSGRSRRGLRVVLDRARRGTRGPVAAAPVRLGRSAVRRTWGSPDRPCQVSRDRTGDGGGDDTRSCRAGRNRGGGRTGDGASPVARRGRGRVCRLDRSAVGRSVRCARVERGRSGGGCPAGRCRRGAHAPSRAGPRVARAGKWRPRGERLGHPRGRGRHSRTPATCRTRAGVPDALRLVDPSICRRARAASGPCAAERGYARGA